MNIYELTGNFLAVQQLLAEDIDNQTLADTLDSIEATIEVKAQNYIMLDKNLEAYSNGLDSEIKRLKSKRDVIENNRNTMKNNLFKNLELIGKTELKTTIATIKQQNNPPSVEIINSELIPPQYLTIIPESYKVRKSDIAKDIKAGIHIDGATLLQTKRWVIK